MKPKWNRFRPWVLLPIAAMFLLAGTPGSARSEVGVSVSFNLGPPAALGAYPSDLVLIPGSDVYFAPISGVDLFFHGGYWWCHRGPRWYRAYSPDGPWGIVEHRYVPAPVYRVPYNYRTAYRHGHRIPFGHWKKYSDRHRGFSGWMEREERRRYGHYDRWDGRRHDRDWNRDRWDGRHGRDGRDYRR